MDKVYIKEVLQRILNKEFSNSQKRRIDEYPDRLNFACPYCQDSSKNIYKKRGNLYLNKLFYICFNCDKKTSFDKLIKNFGEILDPQKKLEIIEYLDSVVDYSDYDTDLNDFKLDDLIELTDLEELFNVKKTTPIFDFKPIDKKGGVFKYLTGRGIPPELHSNIYQAKFSKGDEGFEHIIVLLNRKGDKILGMQIRNLKEGKRRFFLIYNWETIYKWINGEDSELDLNKTVIYNKLSYFFNVLSVNFEKTITIFEGYLDSIFFPNSIGVVGTNTDLKFLENNNIDLQYFYDNDQAGFNKSEEKIKIGGKVFLWNKLFDFIVNQKKSDDPHKLLYRISKVKDLNKLNELVPKSYDKFKLDAFFSIDEYDIKWIPKKVYKKNIKVKDYNKEFNNL